jgi:GAF domain-containing protein
LDVGIDVVYFDNPDLPETRSELAIPLISKGHVIGVLDVQSKEASAFDQEDIEILQILGDQITLAIESANMLTEKDAALVAMDRAYQEMTKKSWQQTFDTQRKIGYRCNSDGRITFTDSRWDEGLVKAAETGEVYDDDSNTLSIPLKIRDQVVGAISFRKPETTSKWVEDEVSLLQTLTDQVSVAMDSARLYMDTQRRADRERLVADITTKIRESNDPKVILQTAVQELQTALKANKAKFSFESVSVGAGDLGPVGNGTADEVSGESEGETF